MRSNSYGRLAGKEEAEAIISLAQQFEKNLNGKSFLICFGTMTLRFLEVSFSAGNFSHLAGIDKHNCRIKPHEVYARAIAGNLKPQDLGYSIAPKFKMKTIATKFLNEIGTAEDANLLAAAIMRDPDIDCDVLFQYCDLREIFEPLGYINVALQYNALPYRKWSNPLDLKEIGMDDLSLHEKCALQLGWELAGKDDSRDRADMSVDELIDFGENEAENCDLVVWLHGYMDPYEGEIDTARYSKEHIIETCERLRCDIDSSRLPEPEECLDDMALAAESALEENKENNLEGEHEEEIPF